MQYEQQPTIKTELSRISPIMDQTIGHIKFIIAQDGFYGVNEFKDTIKETGLADADLIQQLAQEGIYYIKTSGVNKECEQEVMVDVRPLAACMMLAYGERGFALKNSVLKFVESLYLQGDWQGAYQVYLLKPMLDEIYAVIGHNFTVSEVAEASDLSNEDEKLIEERAGRYVHLMRELMKSDAELTAVFYLAARTMDIANGFMISGERASRKHLEYRRFNQPKAYNRFWTIAQTIIDRHYKK